MAPITREDVQNALTQAKKWRAPGPDEVTAELLLSCKAWSLPWMVELFNLCLQAQKVPQDWKDSIIVSLFKNKGCAAECNNYRGISLLSVIGKCSSHILISRLVVIADPHLMDNQFGFRRLRGTVIANGIFQRIIESTELQGATLVALFIDF